MCYVSFFHLLTHTQYPYVVLNNLIVQIFIYPFILYYFVYFVACMTIWSITFVIESAMTKIAQGRM